MEIPYEAFTRYGERVQGTRAWRGKGAAPDEECCWRRCGAQCWSMWRNVFIKKFIWKSTDFLRPRITFTCVCQRCKLFPVEDLLWVVSTDCGERRKKNSMSGWWCGACGQSYDWRKPSRLLVVQIGKWYFLEKVLIVKRFFQLFCKNCATKGDFGSDLAFVRGKVRNNPVCL